MRLGRPNHIGEGIVVEIDGGDRRPGGAQRGRGGGGLAPRDQGVQGAGQVLIAGEVDDSRLSRPIGLQDDKGLCEVEDGVGEAEAVVGGGGQILEDVDVIEAEHAHAEGRERRLALHDELGRQGPQDVQRRGRLQPNLGVGIVAAGEGEVQPVGGRHDPPVREASGERGQHGPPADGAGLDRDRSPSDLEPGGGLDDQQRWVVPTLEQQNVAGAVQQVDQVAGQADRPPQHPREHPIVGRLWRDSEGLGHGRRVC